MSLTLSTQFSDRHQRDTQHSSSAFSTDLEEPGSVRRFIFIFKRAGTGVGYATGQSAPTAPAPSQQKLSPKGLFAKATPQREVRRGSSGNAFLTRVVFAWLMLPGQSPLQHLRARRHRGAKRPRDSVGPGFRSMLRLLSQDWGMTFSCWKF